MNPKYLLCILVQVNLRQLFSQQGTMAGGSISSSTLRVYMHVLDTADGLTCIAPFTSLHLGKESLTTLSKKVDFVGKRVFVRVDFNGTVVKYIHMYDERNTLFSLESRGLTGCVAMFRSAP